METTELNHPIMKDMLKLGCKSQPKIAIAFHVYLNLTEAHALWDINYKYNQDLDLLYFTGRKSKNATKEIFVPVLAKSEISVQRLEELQNALCNHESHGITLAIKDADSTVVLYQFKQDLVIPEAPEDTKLRKESKKQRFKVEIELRNKKESIYEKIQNVDEERTNEEDYDDDRFEEL